MSASTARRGAAGALGTRAARWALACVATSAVFGAGAWLGDDAAARPARPGAGDRRPLAGAAGSYGREIPVGDALWVNGQPMELSLLSTSDGPEQVIRWYSEALGRKGLRPYARADARVGHVSVFDPDDGLQHFVTALPQPDGRTLVLLGATDPRRPPRLGDASALAFPVPPEQRGLLWYASEDAGSRAQNAQFVCALEASAVLAFYRRELVARGYVEQAGGAGAALAVFRKPGAAVSVAVQSLGRPTAAVSRAPAEGGMTVDPRKGTAVFVSRVEGVRR